VRRMGMEAGIGIGMGVGYEGRCGLIPCDLCVGNRAGKLGDIRYIEYTHGIPTGLELHNKINGVWVTLLDRSMEGNYLLQTLTFTLIAVLLTLAQNF